MDRAAWLIQTIVGSLAFAAIALLMLFGLDSLDAAWLANLLTASILPAMSLVFGFMNGARVSVLLSWVVPLWLLSFSSFFLATGYLRWLLVGSTLTVFLAMTFSDRANRWWLQHIYPRK